MDLIMMFCVDKYTEISLPRDLRWLMIEVFWNVTAGRVASPVDSLILRIKAGDYLPFDTT
jgi:hypothetical protein